MVFEALAHRGGLVQKTHPDQTLFRRIGGRPVIDRMTVVAAQSRAA